MHARRCAVRIQPSLTALYEQLLVVSRRTLGNARVGAETLEGQEGRQVERVWLTLVHFSNLLMRVIDQRERRVLMGEKVSAEEKLVSIMSSGRVMTGPRPGTRHQSRTLVW